MTWERDGFTSHEGSVGVLLPDGSEPRPAIFDIGSGSSFYETTDWWVYDGTLRIPRASRMRGKCSCGWRGETSYPIDWEEVLRDDPHAYDTSAPREDWAQHLEDVQARTVPLPADVTDLLDQLRGRLEHLADDAPLAALRAVHELETIIGAIGPSAAFLALREDEIPWDRIAEGLGATEKDARTRLFRYSHRI
ncbi:hypothetical protein J7E93_28290 [Streptomyces sp. ISL-36]|uniref:hypothetical protein n=1 Tax=Streptomyces sp. ISL-36 TaxID=2819182 RepID=UPI001BEC2C2D|nr:hypothetical protein [Streptomyces sp. ISL-36]MBT2443926.1 hypothetical protein [Streptomyces sp. ISL-36]